MPRRAAPAPASEAEPEPRQIEREPTRIVVPIEGTGMQVGVDVSDDGVTFSARPSERREPRERPEPREFPPGQTPPPPPVVRQEPPPDGT